MRGDWRVGEAGEGPKRLKENMLKESAAIEVYEALM